MLNILKWCKSAQGWVLRKEDQTDKKGGSGGRRRRKLTSPAPGRWDGGLWVEEPYEQRAPGAWGRGGGRGT